MIVHDRHDQITWMTHSQSNEYLKETELWQKLYNEAKIRRGGSGGWGGKSKVQKKRNFTFFHFVFS